MYKPLVYLCQNWLVNVFQLRTCHFCRNPAIRTLTRITLFAHFNGNLTVDYNRIVVFMKKKWHVHLKWRNKWKLTVFYHRKIILYNHVYLKLYRFSDDKHRWLMSKRTSARTNLNKTMNKNWLWSSSMWPMNEYDCSSHASHIANWLRLAITRNVLFFFSCFALCERCQCGCQICS